MDQIMTALVTLSATSRENVFTPLMQTVRRIASVLQVQDVAMGCVNAEKIQTSKMTTKYAVSIFFPFHFLIIVHIFDYDSCFRATGVNLVCLSSQLSNLIT